MEKLGEMKAYRDLNKLIVRFLKLLSIIFDALIKLLYITL